MISYLEASCISPDVWEERAWEQMFLDLEPNREMCQTMFTCTVFIHTQLPSQPCKKWGWREDQWTYLLPGKALFWFPLFLLSELGFKMGISMCEQGILVVPILPSVLSLRQSCAAHRHCRDASTGCSSQHFYSESLTGRTELVQPSDNWNIGLFHSSIRTEMMA